MSDAHMFSGLMVALYFGGTLLGLIVEYLRTGRVRDDINTIPRSTKFQGIAAAPPPRDRADHAEMTRRPDPVGMPA